MNNHSLYYYTAQLELLRNEADQDLRYYNSNIILDICRAKKRAGELTREELLLVYVKQREILNN